VSEKVSRQIVGHFRDDKKYLEIAAMVAGYHLSLLMPSLQYQSIESIQSENNDKIIIYTSVLTNKNKTLQSF